MAYCHKICVVSVFWPLAMIDKRTMRPAPVPLSEIKLVRLGSVPGTLRTVAQPEFRDDSDTVWL